MTKERYYESQERDLKKDIRSVERALFGLEDNVEGASLRALKAQKELDEAEADLEKARQEMKVARQRLDGYREQLKELRDARNGKTTPKKSQIDTLELMNEVEIVRGLGLDYLQKLEVRP
ncbi:hypothetical protein B0I72DRAFT_134898 [Yarrowia lipolytica]|uniref:YALI0D26323p n=2 Tax=Yarrowia lipolytica TaxID=4952 RepID=Q6C7Q1_YARLI|nr:YALI0D26323p [Yarrowia lipolytica CLIB122]AOW04678.1 hypothetical protein YALI1_D34840g [Yarrowia lipolytica]KAB8283946.1 hypothetical protein BKA91DRAFT_135946 [Yarrowia lipolytica]KAE8172125.1 hypothetical protein BKA90DRAFT_137822 [Yarrowia lipolytica]KAJ8053898.1 hypothetical protein LXG23DRAFT_55468 [Yarrowia lipolytica]QNP98113.1 Hypothetical protein YALI2_D00554g [Yarrowia lipolytica]|eukprot:XP_503311.2 YALI0D26323p [Yarrowia lipolytica CLIB122]